jgi:hypothetical protein
MLESRVLRRIFRPKRGELTGGWRTLHKEELNDLYSCAIACQNCAVYSIFPQV